jgi:hypothetical protein
LNTDSCLQNIPKGFGGCSLIYEIDVPRRTITPKADYAYLLLPIVCIIANSVINGRVRVQEGRLLGVELPVLVEQHNRLARGLVRGEM